MMAGPAGMPRIVAAIKEQTALRWNGEANRLAPRANSEEADDMQVGLLKAYHIFYETWSFLMTDESPGTGAVVKPALGRWCAVHA